MDTAAASLVELQAEYLRLAGVVVAAQNTRKEIEAEINRRLLAVKAATLVSTMPLQEREALRLVLDAEVRR